ncbi:hypothetical protein POL88_15450 [Priestia megaterium]|uniref:hypothetical protein n=1 Tax=Priestia megaterium TaxID=1404 RepID=UPI00234F2E04|nr:hypothetical protein [Priestia megaterium]MDC7770322.1 hypothetical protein [Priestia megaterium]
MVEDALKVLLDKQPTWFFQVSSVVLIIILGILGFWAFLGSKRFAQGMGKENQLIELLKEQNDLKTQVNTHQSISAQLSTVIENSRSFIDSLNMYRRVDKADRHIAEHFVQTIIEGLSSDVKSVVGEKHRCGLWIQRDDNGSTLNLVHGSAGFPESYINNRTLDINNSIAGRSFRKKESIFNKEDVTLDSDWTPTTSSGSYNALICVPVGNFGVITVDAKQPMHENALLIAELYASICEGFFIEFTDQFVYDAQQQAAVSEE